MRPMEIIGMIRRGDIIIIISKSGKLQPDDKSDPASKGKRRQDFITVTENPGFSDCTESDGT